MTGGWTVGLCVHTGMSSCDLSDTRTTPPRWAGRGVGWGPDCVHTGMSCDQLETHATTVGGAVGRWVGVGWGGLCSYRYELRSIRNPHHPPRGRGVGWGWAGADFGEVDRGKVWALLFLDKA